MLKLLSEVPDPQVLSDSSTESSSSVAASLSKTTKRTGSKEATVKAEERSPYRGAVAKRNVQPPAATEPRQRIDEVPVDRPRVLLSAAYQDMFDSYEVLGALDEKEKDELSEDYRKTLGETIFLCRHAFRIAQKEKDEIKVNELTYLLAYLSYTAGQLVEASVYGEMAARWGDPKEAATREAAMIAIAACQEANASHWGIRDQVGELDQLKSVAEIVQQRWPSDPKLDAIWMHLAQSYFAFGKPLLAAETFLKIDKESGQFESSQLAAGNAYWSHFVDQASGGDPDPKEMVSLLKSADKHLRVAVESMQGDVASPTLNLVSAKLLLAKIAERLGNLDDALQWLEADPMAVTRKITTDSKKKKGMVLVDKSTADAVFDTLYRIKTSKGNWKEAYQSLAKLDAKSHPELGSRYTALAKGLVENLVQANKVSPWQVTLLTDLLKSVETHDAERWEAIQVWIGQSWATFGMKAASDELSKACFDHAESAFVRALKQPDFPESSRLSVAMLRADLFLRSGNPTASLEMIREVLQTSPTAIAFQMRAAKLLQEIAFQQDKVGGLLDAINGPSETTDDGEASPIWGWVKLSNALHQLSYSDKGTEEHRQQSHEANFYLARCQWLLANVTNDPSQRESQFMKLKSQLTRRIALSGVETGQGDVWQTGLETLLAKIE
ncbi:tetratricopeptide repeat protein [Rubripirellula tenax]|uniref:tetratricopeptide repeat protein n=1 Tax=Rubripirellula tenax TaxID=2528015 RepID=UPI001C95B811|nr:tetratricopeptide repeat protein [Rubripirellula tenax]